MAAAGTTANERPMTKDRVALLLLISMFVVLAMTLRGKSQHVKRADTLERAVAMLVADRDSLDARAGRLVVQARVADRVIQKLRSELPDSVVVTSLVVQLDTIRELVPDTVARRMIAQRDTMWQSMVDARDAVIVAQDSSISLWRASSEANAQIIATWERQDELRAEVNAELRRALVKREVQAWTERAVFAGAVAYLIVR